MITSHITFAVFVPVGNRSCTRLAQKLFHMVFQGGGKIYHFLHSVSLSVLFQDPQILFIDQTHIF